MALSSRPFCPYDGRQAGLWYLPARWRDTTGLPDDVDKAGGLEPGAVFTFRVGLPGIESIQENQIEAHGIERGDMRLI